VLAATTNTLVKIALALSLGGAALVVGGAIAAATAAL